MRPGCAGLAFVDSLSRRDSEGIVEHAMCVYALGNKYAIYRIEVYNYCAREGQNSAAGDYQGSVESHSIML